MNVPRHGTAALENPESRVVLPILSFLQQAAGPALLGDVDGRIKLIIRSNTVLVDQCSANYCCHTRVNESEDFLERATGIEPVSKTWEARNKTLKALELAAVSVWEESFN